MDGAEAAQQAHDPLVLGERLEVEPFDPERATYLGQQPDQEPPDAATLPIVNDRYRNLRDWRRMGASDEPSYGHRLARHQCSPRQMGLVVDLGEVGKL